MGALLLRACHCLRVEAATAPPTSACEPSPNCSASASRVCCFALNCFAPNFGRLLLFAKVNLFGFADIRPRFAEISSREYFRRPDAVKRCILLSLVLSTLFVFVSVVSV
jgi:hypothetical protein